VIWGNHSSYGILPAHRPFVGGGEELGWLNFPTELELQGFVFLRVGDTRYRRTRAVI